MRLTPPIVALLLTLTAGAQTQHPIPDAPQPQKNAQPKPEALPQAEPPTKPATDDNAFPESVSQAAATKATPTAPAPKTKDDNPFPESVSKAAAKAAEQDAPEDEGPKPNLPPGVSSSSSLTQQLAPQLDPDRSKKDTEVGDLYLKSRNYQGALLRFQDATRSDPTNVSAIFGLAETQRSLGKTTEAATNYQMYLDILPNGPKSKEAMKALKTLRR
jgi:tetratricopeptide (TPR) repeat protein